METRREPRTMGGIPQQAVQGEEILENLRRRSEAEEKSIKLQVQQNFATHLKIFFSSDITERPCSINTSKYLLSVLLANQRLLKDRVTSTQIQ